MSAVLGWILIGVAAVALLLVAYVVSVMHDAPEVEQ